MLWLAASVQAQTPWQIGGVVGGGYIPYGPEGSGLKPWSLGAGLECSRLLKSEDYWVRFWQQPRYGLHLHYQYVPDQVVGSMWGADAFMEAPVRGNMMWTLGLGLSVFTNPYERNGQETNVFVGSYLNCLIEVGLHYEWLFPDNGSITLGGRLLHASNGYLKKPNIGLNTLMATVGYRIPNPDGALQRSPVDRWAGAEEDMGWRHCWYASYTNGMVLSRWINNGKYHYCWQIIGGYLHKINPCIAFGGDLDVGINGASLEHTRIMHDPYPLPFNVALMGTMECYWGPLSMRLSVGSEVLRARQVENYPANERVGLYYHFGHSGNQWAGIGMKLHWAKIDFIELTYGIALFRS